MSRPKGYKAAEAGKEFVKEIRVRQAYCDMRQYELAQAVGVTPSVMSELLAAPDKINIQRLRRIVEVLEPDPCVVLGYLGYSPKAIRKIREEGTA